MKSQLKLMCNRKSFIVTLLLMIALSAFETMFHCIKYYGLDLVNVVPAKYLYIGSEDIFYAEFCMIFSMLLPIAAVVPFADTYFEERKRKNIEFCLSRTSNSSYYFSKLAVVFISGFVIAFIPLLINMVLNFIAFPLDSTLTVSANNGYYNGGVMNEYSISTLLLGNLYASHMYLYNFLYCLITSVASGLMAMVVYQFSFFYKGNRIILLASFFLVYTFYSVVLGAYNLGEYNISLYIFAGQMFKGQTVKGAIVSIAMLVAGAFLPIPFAKRRLNNCYD